VRTSRSCGLTSIGSHFRATDTRRAKQSRFTGSTAAPNSPSKRALPDLRSCRTCVSCGASHRRIAWVRGSQARSHRSRRAFLCRRTKQLHSRYGQTTQILRASRSRRSDWLAAARFSSTPAPSLQGRSPGSKRTSTSCLPLSTRRRPGSSTPGPCSRSSSQSSRPRSAVSAMSVRTCTIICCRKMLKPQQGLRGAPPSAR
jgi:hypothetical protein